MKTLFLLIGILVFMICILTIWYSFRFGWPLFHTIKWLVNLSKGRLEEPKNRKGQPVSKNKKRQNKATVPLFRRDFRIDGSAD